MVTLSRVQTSYLKGREGGGGGGGQNGMFILTADEAKEVYLSGTVTSVMVHFFHL